MTQIIEVTISPKGETKIETKGFSGAACRQATRALEAALGLRTGETLTAEFFTSQQSETGVAARPDSTA